MGVSFEVLVAMSSLIVSIINFVKFVRARDMNGIATTLAVWIAGVLVVLLVAQTDFAEGISVGDKTLASLNFWSLVFVGLTIAGTAIFGNEIKKALDGGDSAAKPPLVPPSSQ
jgi:hypothetical protein